ncbi:MAG: hypothetical protein IPM25_14550 [Chloracidobacterium sp.]|nr:hypothetical protein [Chloracidobacterium sp.]
MNDAKNIILAWLSAGSPLVMAFGTDTALTILSAVVLPVVLFAIGKSIDVALQIYLRRKYPSGRTKE